MRADRVAIDGPERLTGRVERFERSRARAVFDLAGPAVGGVLFLGVAALMLFGGFESDLLFRLVGGLVFGGFGLFMGAAAIAQASRGLGQTLVAVGDDGVWLPRLGRLAWDELAEVRLETWTGPAGGSDAGRPRFARYRRLAFLPRDPARLAPPGPAERFSGAFAAVMLSLTALASGTASTRLAGPGVTEVELGGRFDALVELVGSHVPVVVVSDEGGAVS